MARSNLLSASWWEDHRGLVALRGAAEHEHDEERDLFSEHDEERDLRKRKSLCDKFCSWLERSPWHDHDDHFGGWGKRCNYQCARHSERKPDRQRYDNQDDCRCISGFCPSSDGKRCETCVDTRCKYQCAEHSVRKPGRQCYDNQDDCRCISGFCPSSDGKRCAAQNCV